MRCGATGQILHQRAVLVESGIINAIKAINNSRIEIDGIGICRRQVGWRGLLQFAGDQVGDDAAGFQNIRLRHADAERSLGLVEHCQQPKDDYGQQRDDDHDLNEGERVGTAWSVEARLRIMASKRQ